MKHKFLIIAACVVAALPSFAQFRVGVEAGYNLSHDFDTSKTRSGFNVGVTGDYSFNDHWYVDAALKLSSQPCGDSFYFAYNNDLTQTSLINYNATPYYLTLPVRAGYKFAISNNSKLSVAVGPMVGLGLFGCSSYHDANIQNHFTNTFSDGNRMEYGANARLGLELSKHYQIGLEYSLLNTQKYDNMGVFSVNFGYKF